MQRAGDEAAEQGRDGRRRAEDPARRREADLARASGAEEQGNLDEVHEDGAAEGGGQERRLGEGGELAGHSSGLCGRTDSLTIRIQTQAQSRPRDMDRRPAVRREHHGLSRPAERGELCPQIRFHTTDPDQLSETLAPVAGDVGFHPLEKGKFHAGLSAFRLPDLAMFSIQLSAAQVGSSAPRGFLGITVPVTTPVEIVEQGRVARFSADSTHLLRPSDPFDLRTSRDSRMLVANIDTRLIEEHARGFDAADGWSEHIQSRLSASTPEGASVRRYLRFLWQELQPEESMLRQARIAREAVDTLASMIVGACVRDRPSHDAVPAHVRRAEEFLVSKMAAPVSLAEVSEVAGVSPRTLSRAFKDRHGMGVIGFLKQRRLEAIHRDLLTAERDSTSVTEVALRYGANHLGRFAAKYRRQFGEYPSDTLRR